MARVGRFEEEGRVGLAAEQLGHVGALARLQQQVLDDGALGVLRVALGQQPLRRRRQQHAVAEAAATVAAAPLGAADAQVQRLGAVLFAAQQSVRQSRRFRTIGAFSTTTKNARMSQLLLFLLLVCLGRKWGFTTGLTAYGE